MAKNHKNKNKKKKEKITYIDDGSSLADMSGVGGGSRRAPKEKKGVRAPFKEQFQTYKDSVKLMFLPMLAVLGIIALTYLIVYIIFILL